MNRPLSLRTGHGSLARLGEWVAGMFERLARNRYRPEKHYMRGPGPKSKLAAANRHE